MCESLWGPLSLCFIKVTQRLFWPLSLKCIVLHIFVYVNAFEFLGLQLFVPLLGFCLNMVK